MNETVVVKLSGKALGAVQELSHISAFDDAILVISLKPPAASAWWLSMAAELRLTPYLRRFL